MLPVIQPNIDISEHAPSNRTGIDCKRPDRLLRLGLLRDERRRTARRRSCAWSLPRRETRSLAGWKAWPLARRKRRSLAGRKETRTLSRRKELPWLERAEHASERRLRLSYVIIVLHRAHSLVSLV